MRRLSKCIVCEDGTFNPVYPSAFDGDWEAAAEIFLTDRHRAVHGGIIKCVNCGFVATSPQYHPDEYAAIYRKVQAGAPVVGAGREKARKQRYRSLAKRVRQYIASGAFLDFGCADGLFLQEMSEFEGIGLDVARAPAEGEGDVLGGTIHEARTQLQARAPTGFDFVTAWDVFEHLPGLDTDLAAVHGLLRPQGLMFCSLPDITSTLARLSGRRWNCLLLEHLWYFSPATFRRFAANHGFDVIHVSGFRYPADLATLVQRLAQTFGIKKILLPPFLGDRVVGLPVGLMFVVCRKRG